ncbi:MAG: methyltransferase domain-containing protein [Boseongicola sp. SB0664_bin_43]|uniref:Methyltransferase domain-containing protein n=1 Tax=Boseongicola sp. SB0664_bin_43 TaxID=2604844 RepID=A0A6B0Y1Q2_9RHOB|nr:methyltransferase domain-containing protein [Boseongicola sp. SB0664_bin_43]
MQPAAFNRPAAPFWDRIAPKYARKPVKDPLAYAEKLDAVEALLEPTDTVLELGCGTGSTAISLARSVAEYTATDVSPAMIGIAEEKGRAAGANNLRFAVGDAAGAAANVPFDVVLAFSLLHLVEDVAAVLASVSSQLKPVGLFVSKTVCMGEANLARRGLVRTLEAFGLAPHVTSLCQVQLEALIQDAGFEIETIRHFGSNRFNPFIVARRRGWRRTSVSPSPHFTSPSGSIGPGMEKSCLQSRDRAGPLLP